MCWAWMVAGVGPRYGSVHRVIREFVVVNVHVLGLFETNFLVLQEDWIVSSVIYKLGMPWWFQSLFGLVLGVYVDYTTCSKPMQLTVLCTDWRLRSVATSVVWEKKRCYMGLIKYFAMALTSLHKSALRLQLHAHHLIAKFWNCNMVTQHQNQRRKVHWVWKNRTEIT